MSQARAGGLPSARLAFDRIGFVTGLQAEAGWLRGQGFLVGVGGGQPAGAAKAAEALVAQGAEALVSFGLAGGLDPQLQPGCVLVPANIVAGTVSYPCDIELTRWLGGGSGRLLAGDDIVATAAAKAALFAATGAAAVDLESGAVAKVARRHSLPMAALRAVADPAQRNLPMIVFTALNSDGAVDLRLVLASVLRRPGQIPALVALGRDSVRARAALRRRLRLLGR